jgi:hypothetical protein
MLGNEDDDGEEDFVVSVCIVSFCGEDWVALFISFEFLRLIE